jgi:hypothetical protein
MSELRLRFEAETGMNRANTEATRYKVAYFGWLKKLFLSIKTNWKAQSECRHILSTDDDNFCCQCGKRLREPT